MVGNPPQGVQRDGDFETVTTDEAVFGDNDKIRLGDTREYSIESDPTSERLKIRDETAGAGRLEINKVGTLFPGGVLNLENNNITNVKTITGEGTQDLELRPGTGTNVVIRTAGGQALVELKDTERVEFPRDVFIEDTARLIIGGGAGSADDGRFIEFEPRGSDPSASEFSAQGRAALYVSDGTADVTGDSTDLIYAVNDGGVVETAIIVDESADAS